jgi:hypothetical protein
VVLVCYRNYRCPGCNPTKEKKKEIRLVKENKNQSRTTHSSTHATKKSYISKCKRKQEKFKKKKPWQVLSTQRSTQSFSISPFKFPFPIFLKKNINKIVNIVEIFPKNHILVLLFIKYLPFFICHSFNKRNCTTRTSVPSQFATYPTKEKERNKVSKRK